MAINFPGTHSIPYGSYAPPCSLGVDEACFNLIIALSKLPDINVRNACSGHGVVPLYINIYTSVYSEGIKTLLKSFEANNPWCIECSGTSIISNDSLKVTYKEIIEESQIHKLADELAIRITNNLQEI